MASLSVKIRAREAWDPKGKLRVYVGTENVASLAESDPPGGALAHEQAAWPQLAEQGGFGAPGTQFGAPGSTFDSFTILCGFGYPGSDMSSFDFGRGCIPPRVLKFPYTPKDINASLPVGVSFVDSAGEESAVVETLVQIADPPRGASNLRATQDIPRNVNLLWDPSPDI